MQEVRRGTFTSDGEKVRQAESTGGGGRGWATGDVTIDATNAAAVEGDG